MDGGTVEDFRRRKAGRLWREHPVRLAVWHVADFVAGLAIKVQDDTEAYLRKAAGEP